MEIDAYLTDNPQVTHFKRVYRRHAPFQKTFIQCDPSYQCAGVTDFFIIQPDYDLLNGIVVELPFVVNQKQDVSEFVQKFEFFLNGELCETIPVLQIIAEDELKECYKSTIETTLYSTLVRPWYWFNIAGCSLPVCGMRANNFTAKFRVSHKAGTGLKVFFHGFRLGEDERRRFELRSTEILVDCRQQQMSLEAFERSFCDYVQWSEKTHVLFGNSFGSATIALLCCLKRTFGRIDRNIIRKIVKECARVSGAQVNCFSADLRGWRKATTWIHFVPRDRKGNVLQYGVLSVQFDDQFWHLPALSHFAGVPGCVMDFAIAGLTSCVANFTIESVPSGSVNISGKTLTIRCDARVHSVQVYGWAYGVARFAHDFAGLAL